MPTDAATTATDAIATALVTEGATEGDTAAADSSSGGIAEATEVTTTEKTDEDKTGDANNAQESNNAQEGDAAQEGSTSQAGTAATTEKKELVKEIRTNNPELAGTVTSCAALQGEFEAGFALWASFGLVMVILLCCTVCLQVRHAKRR